MVRPRFSLRTLLLVTAFIAAMCATLRFPNLWLASAWCLTTVAVLLFSIVATAQRRHRSRAFWLGFAVCGWGFFYMTLFPSAHFPGVAARLATTRVLISLYWALNPNSGWHDGEFRSQPQGSPGGFSGGGFGPSTPQPPAPSALVPVVPAPLSQDEYVGLGNLLWTLLFAFCGGIAGRWLHDTREQSAAR